MSFQSLNQGWTYICPSSPVKVNEHKSVYLYLKTIKSINSVYLNGVWIKIDHHCKYLGYIAADGLSDI